MRSSQTILWTIAGLLILVGCSAEQPAGPADDDGPLILPAGRPDKSIDQPVINHFVVQYDGRTFDGEETTFRYTVFGTGQDPALNQFRLELPACAGEPTGYAPTQSVYFIHDADTNIDYIKWVITIEGDDPVGRQFAISFAGDVPEGAIHSAVRAGTILAVGQVPGPCAGYLIAGAVFVDVDSDGLRGASESGIADVAVELVNPDGSVAAVTTDADGAFAVHRVAGTYTVRIPYEGYPESFNAELQASFDATTSLAIQVTVGPDATGNDFGFAPRTDTIIDELDSGGLTSTGQTVMFWRKQIHWARHDVHNPHVVHDRAELETFLAAIQQLYLPEIFQFTPGHELDEAYLILRTRPRRLVDELRQQLLATELNEVSGRGLVDDPALQDVLIAWGEAIWVENQDAARSPVMESDASIDQGGVILSAPELIPPAISIFTRINTGGGGGVDEKR